ncbi:hypothetical protein LDE05_00240 [Lactobacillus delbrueckii subsp. bulgaricus]|uniref:Transposase n=1 Tax=Lactobacillus delbrueckii subsp. bulgaricus TaxID=1585 RepID=A0AAV5PEV1_LACDE|nr:hypothetical protein LDE05_00240 [Lactobacillus delbrueckii subsp. bulgaricus]GMB84894.1 hypothetical protein ME0899_11190 [Lactobacillus delbrueckii subsp. bulgaricus]GMB86122.1 hypothetical protein ME0900_04940 [Lactobacillus delbrueckii subsp. bulgaricus]GMB88741.1 hypothetical protein ME0901_12630 [Lactobacillus delbrueckii subsp. bulgaricus]
MLALGNLARQIDLNLAHLYKKFFSFNSRKQRPLATFAIISIASQVYLTMFWQKYKTIKNGEFTFDKI